MTSAEYSIGVTNNRFELFDLGDEDPLELLRKQQEEREARKKAKLTEKEAQPKTKAPPAAPKPKPEKKSVSQEKPKDDSAKTAPERKPVEAKRGNFRGQEDWDDSPRNREDRGNQRDFQEEGGFRKGGEYRGRGGRGGAGGSSFRGRTFQRGAPGGGSSGGGGGNSGGSEGRKPFEGRGKREFDRHSGSNKTGVKPTEKREGSGGYNWGNPKDDWNSNPEEDLNSSHDKENWDTSNEADRNGQPDETVSADKDTTELAPPSQTDNPDANPETDAPKEELTLDEWRAKKGPKAAPEFNVRKPGEGEDQNQWKKMYALRKKKDGEDEEEEYEYIDYPQRVGRQRHVLDIDIRYKDSRGSNTSRGRGRGRGGFRGGNPDRSSGGPPREQTFHRDAPVHPGKEVPKVDDEHDFPSLG